MRSGTTPQSARPEQESGRAGKHLQVAFLLLSLLVKNANGTYGTLDSPRLSNLYRDLQTLAEDEGFSSEGLSRATIYNKLKSALSVQPRHAD